MTAPIGHTDPTQANFVTSTNSAGLGARFNGDQHVWLPIIGGVWMTAFQGLPAVHWKAMAVCSWP